MTAKVNTFRKKEHLCLDKEVEVLFGTGRRAISYPFRALYVAVPYSGVGLKLLVQVPKRRVRHAVRRNLIKRRLREAYRTQKHAIIAQAAEMGYTLHVAIIYIGDGSAPTYADTSRAVHRLLIAISQGLSGTAIAPADPPAVSDPNQS